MSSFRVVIVGGSIAGLGLALMLEKAGIDFLVLEAYHEIAPQLGAGLGIQPNGARILDQLGCYEDILRKDEHPTNEVVFRSDTGEVLKERVDWADKTIDNHGYPTMFFDRRILVETLYEHIQNKNAILRNKRVSSIEQDDASVTVTTKDGSTYKGDIVVGADGLHSTVREEMWRLKAKDCATTSEEISCEEELSAIYACIYGISKGSHGFIDGCLQNISGNGSSVFVTSGPRGRIYWALFVTMKERLYGHRLPGFGPSDEEAMAKLHWDDPVTETLTFGKMYSRKMHSGYTPLHEYVLKTWYHKRMMLIGDACHKLEPIGGEGGNQALETASALLNNLLPLLKSKSSSDISVTDLERAFQAVQNLRRPRAKVQVASSNRQQKMASRDTAFHSFLGKYLAPRLSDSMILDFLAQEYAPAVSIDSLDIPPRPRKLPYFDEFPNPSAQKGSLPNLLTFATFGTLSCLSVYLLHTVAIRNGTFDGIKQLVEDGGIAHRYPLSKEAATMSQIAGLDKLFRTMVAMFFPAVTGCEKPESKVQTTYFLLSGYLPVVAIMLVEGFRRKNRGTFIASTSIWFTLIQMFGVAVIAPLYYALNFLNAQKIPYYLPTRRGVSLSNSKALGPSLLFFVVPSVLMLTLNEASAALRWTILFWLVSPMLAVKMTPIFARVFETSDPQDSAENRDGDIVHLNRLYNIGFYIAAVVHIATFAFLGLSTQYSLHDTFIPQNIFGKLSPAQGMAIFLQFDFILLSIATFCWAITTVWDLNRVGILERQAWKEYAQFAIEFLLLGPGASLLSLWTRREKAMANARFKGASWAPKSSKAEMNGHSSRSSNGEINSHSTTSSKIEMNGFGKH